ncbi:MAG TPA: PAS domain-containing protein [Roseiflexaceae bacterium]|nr:PAS domain-containing protein [Roseiflexaceae bacterium]
MSDRLYTPANTEAQCERALRERIAELERQLATASAPLPSSQLAPMLPILDAIPIPIYVKDRQGAYQGCNSAYEALLGLPTSQIIGKTSAEIDPDDLAEYTHQADLDLMQQRESQTYESVVLYPDGTSHDVIITKMAFCPAEGIVGGMVGALQDITEGKRADLLLQNGEWLQAQFLDALPVGICVVDMQGRLFYANQVAQQLLGADAVPGSDVDHFAALCQAYVFGTTQEYPSAQLPLKRALAGERTMIEDLEIRHPDRRITLEVKGMPIRSVNGTVIYAMASFTDITERRMAQEALRLRAEHEEVIHAQAASLLELSTPLLTVSAGVVVMPLIGAIDSTRAKQVMDVLLGGVAEQHATAAILDITGVAVVDTQVANVLLRAAQATKLLGAQVVITGIRPEIAQTLVGLGVDLNGIITRSTLQSGITWAIANATKRTAATRT